MEAAARAIYDAYGCAVLCKGGHRVSDANDYLWDGTAGQWFRGVRIENPNTHGTGCTLSSAMAANLAKGFSLADSVRRAKTYLSGALGAMLDPGAGGGAHGPRVCPARPLAGGGAPVTGGPLGAGGSGGYPLGGWGSHGASGRSAPLPRLPGGGPHFSREMGRKRAGAAPLDPGVHGPLTPVRSFWGSLSLIG